jgi:hypothetical protein
MRRKFTCPLAILMLFLIFSAADAKLFLNYFFLCFVSPISFVLSLS